MDESFLDRWIRDGGAGDGGTLLLPEDRMQLLDR
jgi:hypothetical protein